MGAETSIAERMAALTAFGSFQIGTENGTLNRFVPHDVYLDQLSQISCADLGVLVASVEFTVQNLTRR